MTTIRILNLEDDPRDARLIRDTLATDGLACNVTVVNTRDQFVAALERGGCDVVLADYKVPGFDGLEALDLAHALRPGVPFIFVTGALGEERAIDTLKRGATDYVMKDRIARLVPAVTRAIAEAEERILFQRADEALHRSEEKLRLALEAAQMGTWEWQAGADEVSLSDRTRALFGLGAGALLTYDRFVQAMHTDDRRSFDRAVRDAARDRAVFDLAVRVWGPDRAVRWIALMGRGFGTADGTGSRVVAAAFDVTEHRHREESLREADRRKSEFLATLSHELRNPLAPICYALRLLDGGASPSSAHAREVIERQVKHLVRLVDDLLDATRIASNKIRLQAARLDLQTIVQAALEAASPNIEQANHQVIVSLGDGPIWLEGDFDRLVQVFTNLLNNAARFTPSGGRIGVTTSNDGGDVVVAVADTGIGLRAEHLQRVFEMFSQVREPGRGGLGIGLALVKGIVELHGGSVSVRSEGPGQGSVFEVRLPRAEVVTAHPADVGRARGARRVLVVDDNPDAADLVKTMLEEAGHQVRIARDGHSGLNVAREFRPDIALLDIGLPDMTGYELVRRIKEDARTRDTYLVAVTGWGQEEDRQRAYVSGFDEHLTKPVDPKTIEQMVARAPARGETV